jgi:hypothetical protein
MHSVPQTQTAVASLVVMLISGDASLEEVCRLRCLIVPQQQQVFRLDCFVPLLVSGDSVPHRQQSARPFRSTAFSGSRIKAPSNATLFQGPLMLLPSSNQQAFSIQHFGSTPLVLLLVRPFRSTAFSGSRIKAPSNATLFHGPLMLLPSSNQQAFSTGTSPSRTFSLHRIQWQQDQGSFKLPSAADASSIIQAASLFDSALWFNSAGGSPSRCRSYLPPTAFCMHTITCLSLRSAPFVSRVRILSDSPKVEWLDLGYACLLLRSPPCCILHSFTPQQEQTFSVLQPRFFLGSNAES